MQSRYALRWRAASLLVIAALLVPGVASGSPQATPSTSPRQQAVDTTPLRITQPLLEGWRFVQNDNLTDAEALAATGADWEAVTLPHTWNAQDAASLTAEDYKRGLGWYRLSFASPTAGTRHWLEFGAASLVADVWLNGEWLGQHKGGFTAFRFDITANLAPNGENVLLVKANNTEPEEEDDITAIEPLRGDFNVNGGLYRYVSLISTPGPVHFDLGDLGGPGVYAATTDITAGNATVNVRSRLTSEAAAAGGYSVRTSLLTAAGQVAASAEQPVQLGAGGDLELAQDLTVPAARLWQGKADPYQYQLVSELLQANGTPVDRVVQWFGIRMMRFDVDEGFFLNGQPLRLHGVAMHQDYLGKGWAQAMQDWDTSFNLIMEIGANAVRFGHYPFPKYALDRADALGLVVMAEKPNGQRTTVKPCTTPELSEEFMENAKLQLEEMILQQYNHASVATWSIGNEAEFGQIRCDEPNDTIRPYVQELHDHAKAVDPSRPTVYAEYPSPLERLPEFDLTGITDLLATNRYFLWYSTIDLGEILDGLHADLASEQPLSVSEYGAGAALTHHTDNPRGGTPDTTSAPDGQTSHQPEEYAAYAHAQNYQIIAARDYLWGSFAWNMFDFGSGHRNEGDVLGVNTKGLVTFDRQTRKDPFYFYKANWSTEPVTYIVGRRYTDRAYALNDVTIFSNADSVQLTVNGTVVGSMTADQCPFRTCVFEDIVLNRGANTVTAVGTHGGQTVTDEVAWNFNQTDINIAAGEVTTGHMSSAGDRFGSDNFFIGGTATTEGVEGDITNTADPELYRHFRRDEFSYEIPLENGAYEVTLGFIEPYDTTEEGERVFDVVANGTTMLDDFDILAEAGEPRFVVTETFTVDVTNGLLTLDFTPSASNAMVSTIMVHRAGGGAPPPQGTATQATGPTPALTPTQAGGPTPQSTSTPGGGPTP